MLTTGYLVYCHPLDDLCQWVYVRDDQMGIPHTSTVCLLLVGIEWIRLCKSAMLSRSWVTWASRPTRVPPYQNLSIQRPRNSCGLAQRSLSFKDWAKQHRTLNDKSASLCIQELVHYVEWSYAHGPNPLEDDDDPDVNFPAQKVTVESMSRPPQELCNSYL